MGLWKGDPEEKARKAEKWAERDAKAEANRRRVSIERTIAAFWKSPAGLARESFKAGDHVFQYSIDVMSQQAIIVAMVGSATSSNSYDPSDVLNSVCRQGWELVNGDFVFLMEGQQSRDKFATSGQNVAVKGTVMGYYLFKRCEANLAPETDSELEARVTAHLPQP